MPLLEIACFNISSALSAADAGADRIELCDNVAAGGTTPSYGTIKLALEKIDIPVFPIIRPRGGDFLYTDAEYETMLQDVKLCGDLGCKGVVLGLLQPNGNIDTARTAALVKAAGDMEVTFHRAFDRAANPHNALEDIINTGCKRILTSGQRPTAEEGLILIQELVQRAGNSIIIMPGSGIRSRNLQTIASSTVAKEFHSSAKVLAASQMQFSVANFEEDLRTEMVDLEEIGQMKTILAEL